MSHHAPSYRVAFPLIGPGFYYPIGVTVLFLGIALALYFMYNVRQTAKAVTSS